MNLDKDKIKVLEFLLNIADLQVSRPWRPELVEFSYKEMDLADLPYTTERIIDYYSDLDLFTTHLYGEVYNADNPDIIRVIIEKRQPLRDELERLKKKIAEDAKVAPHADDKETPNEIFGKEITLDVRNGQLYLQDRKGKEVCMGSAQSHPCKLLWKLKENKFQTRTLDSLFLDIADEHDLANSHYQDAVSRGRFVRQKIEQYIKQLQRDRKLNGKITFKMQNDPPVLITTVNG
jgi:hypothetical protein